MVENVFVRNQQVVNLILQSILLVLEQYKTTFDCEPNAPGPCHASGSTGEMWVLKLLNGHPDRIRNQFGVQKVVFNRLIKELRSQGLEDIEFVTLEEQLGIFLFICATGSSSDVVAEQLKQPKDTIIKCFNRILWALSEGPIYPKYVKLSRFDDATPADNPTTHPFFEHAIGAVDVMRIPWNTSEGTNERHAWRNNRRAYSQSCLVCCNFNLEFTYVVSGWEGSANDKKLYDDSCKAYFSSPSGKYHLADISFPMPLQLLVPYRDTRHRSLEWERCQARIDAHDNFNTCHTRLRKVAEQAIHLLKQRFRILTITSEFQDTNVQVRIPIALDLKPLEIPRMEGSCQNSVLVDSLPTLVVLYHGAAASVVLIAEAS